MSRPAEPHRLGAFGEHLAADFLRRRGFTIVGRNVRIGRAEIDLLVRRSGRTVAVEVKTVRGRDGIDPPDPRDQLDASQIRRLRDAIRALDRPVARIDLMAVTITDHGADLRWVKAVG